MRGPVVLGLEPAKLRRLIKDSYTLDSWFSDGNNTHNLNLEGSLWTLNGVIVVLDVEDLRQLTSCDSAAQQGHSSARHCCLVLLCSGVHQDLDG